MKTFILALTLIISPLFAEARIEVAFLEAWTRSGSKVELEKGDRFAHVAILHRGFWLHSSPRNGTELVNKSGIDIQVFYKNEITEVLVNDDVADLTDAQVNELLGQPYDFKFRWDDHLSSYCSKLVGKLLAIQPLPMRFDGSYFQGIKNLPIGEPGLSPDGVYRELIKRGYTSIHIDN